MKGHWILLKKCGIGLGLLLSSAVLADTVTPVITLDTDVTDPQGEDLGRATAEIITDDADGAIRGFVFQASGGYVSSFTLAELQQPQPVFQVQGFEILLLSVEPDFNPRQGGHLNLRFLTNGLGMFYRNFRMLIDRQGTAFVLRSDPDPNDPRSDGNRYTSVFNHLFLKENAIFGRTIGIRAIVPSLE